MTAFLLKPLLRRPLMPLLVVLQVALACAIATNTLFLMQQDLAPLLADDGVHDPAQVVVLSNLSVRGAPLHAAELRAVEADLRVVPGVATATYAAVFPMVGDMLMQADVTGTGSRGSANAVIYVGSNLVNTLGLKMLAGRNFTVVESAMTLDPDMGLESAGPVIITKALAERLYPAGRAIGKTIRFSRSLHGDHTIVGVVQHLMRNRLTQRTQELDYSVLLPGWVNGFPAAIFAVRTGRSEGDRVCTKLIGVIQRRVGSRLVAGGQVRCDSYTDLRARALAGPRAAVWLLSGVTLIVLIVTLTGVMGMTGYWVQQCFHDLGVRRALGARRRDILRELLVENLLVVGAGALAGVASAYGINFWLMRHYEVLRLPWTYLPFSATALLMLGQLAALGPALRASRIVPIDAIRAP